MPKSERPRERLQRLGPDALTDAEVLALVLGAGLPGRNVVDAARELLAAHGGFAGILALSASQLAQLPGIGPATIGRLVAATEMWRRASTATTLQPLADSSAIALVVLPELQHRALERFVVVVADRGLRLREVVLVREGSALRVQVEVAEVLQTVLLRGGTVFAVAHNHPGGSLQPSAADAAFTAQLRAAAVTVRLRFLDHLIVAGSEWRSLT